MKSGRSFNAVEKTAGRIGAGFDGNGMLTNSNS